MLQFENLFESNSDVFDGGTLTLADDFTILQFNIILSTLNYAVCCVHPLPNFGLVFCEYISETEFFTMFFFLFWGLSFFLRLETQCGGWPSLLLKERGTAIVMRFRRRDGIWSCIGCECCVLLQKRNRRAGVKLLSFQFNCFHFKCSIPTCFFLSFTFSLKHIIIFTKCLLTGLTLY